jgi:3-phosphoshikimate 1-carboxyvinyltransferase
VTGVVVAAGRGARLTGTLRVPSDKSVTQRALLLGAIAHGTTRIVRPLDSDDVRALRRALARLGVEIVERDDTLELRAPERLAVRGDGPLDLQNSGTAVRLLMGLLAGAGTSATLAGDASLSRRPMERIVRPLTAMGARFEGADPGRLPLTISSQLPLKLFDGELAVASAQVKSAILLAALGASGETCVTEPAPTRAHTEHLLRAFGARLTIDADRRTIRILGPQRLRATTVEVAADPSSAAFHAAAAALLPGSRVELTEVLVDPRRARFFEVLERMGARVRRVGVVSDGGELVGTLVVESGDLVATDVEPAEVPDLIDELPLVAVVAAFARGTTRVRGAAELRVKESDRLAALCEGLTRLGARVTLVADGFDVVGGAPLKGAPVRSFGDHRIAMAFAIAALRCDGPVAIDDFACVVKSYPGFRVDLARLLGADPMRNG